MPGPNDPFQILFTRPQAFRNAYAHQASFEIERAFGGTSLLIGYNFNRGAHLPRLRDLNVKYGSPNALGEQTLVPVDPNAGAGVI